MVSQQARNSLSDIVRMYWKLRCCDERVDNANTYLDLCIATGKVDSFQIHVARQVNKLVELTPTDYKQLEEQERITNVEAVRWLSQVSKEARQLKDALERAQGRGKGEREKSIVTEISVLCEPLGKECGVRN